MIGALLICLLILSSCSKSTNPDHFGYNSDGWTKESKKINLSSYKGNDVDIIIPSQVRGYTVATLEGVFEGNQNILNVTVPNSVSGLSETFNGCKNLIGVKLPDSLTNIGNRSFKNCSSLSELSLPPKLEHIGDEAFYGCKGLRTLTIPDTIKSIGDEAFATCSNLFLKKDPSDSKWGIYIPGKVKKVGNKAFHGTPASSIWLEDGVETIGNGAFSTKRISKVRIPDSVTSIGKFAFCYTKTIFTYGNDPSYWRFQDPVDDIKPEKVTLIVKEGSYAETYAKNEGYQVEYE